MESRSIGREKPYIDPVSHCPNHGDANVKANSREYGAQRQRKQNEIDVRPTTKNIMTACLRMHGHTKVNRNERFYDIEQNAEYTEPEPKWQVLRNSKGLYIISRLGSAILRSTAVLYWITQSDIRAAGCALTNPFQNCPIS